MIPTDKADQAAYLRGVKIAEQLFDQACQSDACVLNAPYFGEPHDNAVLRYVRMAEVEGRWVLEGLTAVLSDFVAHQIVDGAHFREYARQGFYYAQHPERAAADLEAERSRVA